MNFGSHFQTMKKVETDSKRRVTKARATVDWNGHETKTSTTRDTTKTKSDMYIMHIVLIDSMLQTALVASSAGHIADLACMVPKMIEDASFIAPYGVEQANSLVVHAISEQTGPGSIRIAAELYSSNGELCGQMGNVTAVAFQGIQDDQSAIDERHPMMKIIWKPDITKLTARTAPGVSKHLARVAAQMDDKGLGTSLGKLAEMGCVFAHKQPRLDILELGGPFGGFAGVRLAYSVPELPFLAMHRTHVAIIMTRMSYWSKISVLLMLLPITLRRRRHTMLAAPMTSLCVPTLRLATRL